MPIGASAEGNGYIDRYAHTYTLQVYCEAREGRLKKVCALQFHLEKQKQT